MARRNAASTALCEEEEMSGKIFDMLLRMEILSGTEADMYPTISGSITTGVAEVGVAEVGVDEAGGCAGGVRSGRVAAQAGGVAGDRTTAAAGPDPHT